MKGHLGGSVGWVSDLGSGHDLMVYEFKPHIGLCADSVEPAWGSQFLSLSYSSSLSAPSPSQK